jgi:TolA-binding protein
MLLLAAIVYGIMTGRKPEAPILTFDQQAHQQESTTELASLPPATQAEFDAAMQTLRAGNFEQGKTRILAFIAQHPQSSQAELGYLALADTYRQRQNDPDEALVYYQKLLEEYPQSTSKGLVHLKMGFAYEDMEDRSNAEAMYRLVLQEHGSQSRLGQLATQRLHAFSDEP